MFRSFTCRWIAGICLWVGLSIPKFVSAEIDYDLLHIGENVEADQVIIKVKPSFSPLSIKAGDGKVITGQPELDAVLSRFKVISLERMFILPAKVMDNPKAADLVRYYKMHFADDQFLLDLIQALEDCPQVEFAEPVPIHKLLYEPNDPRFDGQWHLERCGFEAAWNVSRGSRDIVIGIVDSGIDMNADEQNILTIHEDLAANLWRNLGEDIDGDGEITIDDWNGADDDDNGFTDDFYGWDFTGRDNWPDDPWGRDNGHGTHVAGVASAVSDNEQGIASAGFSSSLMIAGCYSNNSPDNIQNGYEGLVYCAANGADVINLSWGSDSQPFRSARESVEFALAQGSAIFAGAGNDGVEDHQFRQTHFYPCAYDGVIGVAASDPQDDKPEWSNYGDYSDLVAPGSSILSTFPRNGYRSLDGTSMSSPLAAGLGALFLSVMPDLSVDELLAWMQRTATDISGRNQDYNGIRYRINADRLLNSTHPNFHITEWSLTDFRGDGDGRPEPTEEVRVNFTISNEEGFTNAEGVSYTLSTDDPQLIILDAQGDVGDLAAGDQLAVQGENAPVFAVRSASQPHYSAIRLTFTDDNDYSQSIDIQLTIGQPPILLVDDDAGAQFQDYYKADLAIRPFIHDTWSIADGLPEQQILNDFNVIIWVTGNSEQTLSPEEQNLIANFLDSHPGRGLILSSQFAGEDIGDGEFFRNYLNVEHAQDNLADPQLTGVQDNPITDGVTLLLIGGNGAGNNVSPSGINPLEGTSPILTYNRSGAVAGTYYNSGDFQTIYLGFALEAASGLGGTTSRDVLLSRALDYLHQQDAPGANEIIYPRSFQISEIYPNPFNNSFNFKVAIPQNSPIKLQIVDLNGRTVGLIYRGLLTAGIHQFGWSGDGLASGSYLIRLSHPVGATTSRVVMLK